MMIFGNIEHVQEGEFLPKALQKCLAYAKAHDLGSYEKGTHKIEGDDFYVNIAEYETTTREKRFWEAHKKYLDIHLMLKGKECIDLNFISRLQVGEYKEADDFLALEGELAATVKLQAGDFLVCLPEDGHRTAVSAGAPCKLKKAIFKVRL